MSILGQKNLRKGILSLILIWGTAFFWLLNPVMFINISVTIISMLCLFSILTESNSHFIVIFTSFISSYVLYGYILINNFPVWLMMIGILLIYIFLYGYLEQTVEMPSGEKTIYLLVFALVSVETFLFLGYFVISPINRSLILSGTVYIIYGFLDTIITKKDVSGFRPYILVFLAIFVTMLISASWGSM